MDLGYVYDPRHQLSEPTGFTAVYQRGARLSHAWVRISNKDVLPEYCRPVDLSYLGDALDSMSREQWQYSTLDLVPIDHFVLLHTTPGTALAKVVITELAARSVPFKCIELGKDFDFELNCGAEAAGKVWTSAYGSSDQISLLRPSYRIGQTSSLL
jgi:hypothetical protein